MLGGCWCDYLLLLSHNFMVYYWNWHIYSDGAVWCEQAMRGFAIFFFLAAHFYFIWTFAMTGDLRCANALGTS